MIKTIKFKSKKGKMKMEKYIGKKVLVRGIQSGVYFGTLLEREGQECRLAKCRNIWYWSGAASLLQLANEGVKRPNDCKFSMAVSEIVLTDICEIVPCAEEGIKNIEGVREWKM